MRLRLRAGTVCPQQFEDRQAFAVVYIYFQIFFKFYQISICTIIAASGKLGCRLEAAGRASCPPGSPGR